MVSNPLRWMLGFSCTSRSGDSDDAVGVVGDTTARSTCGEPGDRTLCGDVGSDSGDRGGGLAFDNGGEVLRGPGTTPVVAFAAAGI